MGRAFVVTMKNNSYTHTILRAIAISQSIGDFARELRIMNRYKITGRNDFYRGQVIYREGKHIADIESLQNDDSVPQIDLKTS